MCTYVPDTWSPMCSLDVRICLGQIEPCSEIPKHFVATKDEETL